MSSSSITLAARRRVLAVLATATALVGFALPGAAPAQAWAWDSHVVLNGRVACNYATSNTVQWMYVAGSNGEGGYATLGAVGMKRTYTFHFYRAPRNMNVTVSWGCAIDGRHSTSFGVARPATNIYATRNICYWTPCWI